MVPLPSCLCFPYHHYTRAGESAARWLCSKIQVQRRIAVDLAHSGAEVEGAQHKVHRHDDGAVEVPIVGAVEVPIVVPIVGAVEVPIVVPVVGAVEVPVGLPVYLRALPGHLMTLSV